MNKISLVIPSLQSGGMERVMSELARYFEGKEDLKVNLILYGKTREIFFSVPDSIDIYKPSFDFTDYTRTTSTIKTLSFLRTTVKKLNPDVILSFGEYWNSFVLLALFGLEYPLFISDRCQPNKSLGKFHDLLRKWLYPRADGIIAQTSKAKEIYSQENLNDNIQVIGNPIYKIPTNGQASEEENIILTVGRLIKSKHHDRLIKIFKKISPENWELVIVGGNALKQSGRQRLRKLVDKLDMAESVKFTGTVSDIEKYYQKSKIFAFTSSSEGFPNVIGEAMSAGLPIITYDCVAGPSDMVDNGQNGYLIPLYNDELFAKRLERLINNPDLRMKMGKESQKRIEKFRIKNIGDQYLRFILND